MIEARLLPQQAFRACLGVLRLGKKYGGKRLQKACARALSIGAISYKSIESILKQGLDQKPLIDSSFDKKPTAITHDNLRGPNYYHH